MRAEMSCRKGQAASSRHPAYIRQLHTPHPWSEFKGPRRTVQLGRDVNGKLVVDEESHVRREWRWTVVVARPASSTPVHLHSPAERPIAVVSRPRRYTSRMHRFGEVKWRKDIRSAMFCNYLPAVVLKYLQTCCLPSFCRGGLVRLVGGGGLACSTCA
jgi:hypothetical protein